MSQFPLSPCLSFPFASGTGLYPGPVPALLLSQQYPRAVSLVGEKVVQSVHLQHCHINSLHWDWHCHSPNLLIHVHSKGQQLWQCMNRAQRWQVYRKSWPHQGNWNIIPGLIISTAMANVQMWNYMYGIINRFNYKKELNACWKQQREVKVSDVIVTRGPSTFCT